MTANKTHDPELKGHIHAEHMALYAEDAKTHAEPWKLWQITQSSLSDIGWIDCKFSPGWDPICKFRRKPNVHIVNGVEVPDLRITPELEQYYWYPDPSGEALVFRSIRRQWSASDNHRIANNLCYVYSDEGKQAAILHTKAWLGLV